MWDKALVATLAHEFKRCKSAFSVYVVLHQTLLRGSYDEDIKLGCYNAYVDFVAHLYEFYLACIKHDSRYPRDPKPEQIDAAVHAEVTRLLKIRRERILRGDAPSWENHTSVYEVKVPEEFGRSLRKVRNLRSHVNPQRVDFDLGEFYQKFHFFLYLMYEEAIWLWDAGASNAPKQDWGEIERFANSITPNDSVKGGTQMLRVWVRSLCARLPYVKLRHRKASRTP